MLRWIPPTLVDISAHSAIDTVMSGHTEPIADLEQGEPIPLLGES